MNPEEIRDFCLSMPGTTEDFPFDEEVLVFKVSGKIFLLTNIMDFRSINLKCDPEKALELRERYAAVLPGYHMNKKHWNTVEIPGDYQKNDLMEWIEHSYRLVFQSLPLRIRNQITQKQEI